MKDKLNLNALFFDGIRFYLALIFLVYAKNKLLQDQFSFQPSLLETQVKNVSLLELQWYIYSFEPFNYFIGITQLVTVFLLVFRKTVFWGAISFIVIITNIVIVNLSVMDGWVQLKMVSKAVFLLGLALILLAYYKTEIKKILSSMHFKKVQQKLSIRSIILTILLAVAFNCLSIFPKYVYLLFTDPTNLYATFMYDLKDSLYMFGLVWKNWISR